nr:glutamine amidotransferase [uncultured Gellertiella sp.]
MTSILSEPATPLHPPVLIILHQERSSPGRVGQMLQAKGFPLDIRRPALGDPLPKTLANHSGAVIFGGPMSVNDPEAYVKAEIDWVSVPLSEGKPFFGICLGAQMLVRQLGGTVKGHDSGHTEIGWYPIAATPAGQALIDWPQQVYQFHIEGFDLPKDATLLAEGSLYPNQAFRYGKNAFGIQFHAELTRAMMQRWVVHGAHRFVLPNAQPGRAHLEGRFLYDDPLKQWLWNFLDLVFAGDISRSG